MGPPSYVRSVVDRTSLCGTYLYMRAFVKTHDVSLCNFKYLIFSAMYVNIVVVWDVAPCILVDRCQYTRCHVPEDRNYHVWRCTNTSPHPLTVHFLNFWVVL
jgi:hypothetical protein